MDTRKLLEQAENKMQGAIMDWHSIQESSDIPSYAMTWKPPHRPVVSLDRYMY